MLNQKKLLSIATFIFIFFLIFSAGILAGAFISTDRAITVFLQTHLPRIVDTPFSYFSLIGSLEFATLILLIIGAIMRKLNFIYVLIFFGLMHVIELVGKTFVSHSPPPVKFFRYDLNYLFPSSGIQPGSSYPSGHASRTAFLTALILLLVWNSKKFSKNQKLIIVGIFVLFDISMFVSRVYLGEHWTSDVIGGILIGFSFGIISFVATSSKNFKLPRI